MKLLTSLQTNFLQDFFQSYIGKDFFLTGGTALSVFYFKHRLSEDLDLFTIKQDIEFNTVNAEILKMIASLSGKIVNQVSTPTYLQFIFEVQKDSLKVDIVRDIFPHFGKVIRIDKIIVDSLENIAVGKLLALFGRAAAKDFIDLYFLLKVKKTITFERLFNLAKKKDIGLSEFYLAGMLSRIEDLRYFPEMLIPYDRKEMVTFFQSLSHALYKKIKPRR